MDEYISREAAVRYLKGYSEKERNSNSPYGMITSSVLNKAERALSEMPSADVQSVKHGRWIISNIYAQCSECSVAYDLDTFNRLIPVNEKVPRHCSYCGTRMCGE